MQSITQTRIPHNTLTTFTVDYSNGGATFEIVGLFYRTANKDKAETAKNYLMDCLRADGCKIPGVLETLEQIGLQRWGAPVT